MCRCWTVRLSTFAIPMIHSNSRKRLGIWAWSFVGALRSCSFAPRMASNKYQTPFYNRSEFVHTVTVQGNWQGKFSLTRLLPAKLPLYSNSSLVTICDSVMKVDTLTFVKVPDESHCSSILRLICFTHQAVSVSCCFLLMVTISANPHNSWFPSDFLILTFTIIGFLSETLQSIKPTVTVCHCVSLLQCLFWWGMIQETAGQGNALIW